MERVKGVGDLNILIIGTQGIVGAGACFLNYTWRAGPGFSPHTVKQSSRTRVVAK
jgi:hypothetical protein